LGFWCKAWTIWTEGCAYLWFLWQLTYKMCTL
jgi:hypothetical protein